MMFLFITKEFYGGYYERKLGYVKVEIDKNESQKK